MKEIPILNKKTNQTLLIKVDDDDFEKVNQFKWTLHPRGYARSSQNVLMHHLIIGNKYSEGLVVDHKNRDKLDNRKENLHFVSFSKNSQNAIRKINKHGYIGISKTINEKFQAIINVSDQNENKRYHSKVSDNPEEAAKFYDIFAFHLFGNTALTNNLIKYDDAIKIDLKEILTKLNSKDLPLNITKPAPNIFQVKRKYKKKIFIKTTKSFDEALKILEDFNEKINEIKNKEKEESLNKIITKDDYGAYILSNKNEKIYVDEKYWHELIKFKWNVNQYGYAMKQNKDIIHRYIIEYFEKKVIPKNYVIDHINHIRLDNRVENLRISSISENNHNRTKRKNTSSKYIGVSYSKYASKWSSLITFEKKRYNIGNFSTEKEAAEAYNKKAIELYGDKAKINVFED